MKTLFFRIKRNIINAMVINGKYKSIPFILIILVILFIVTKLIYEIFLLKWISTLWNMQKCLFVPFAILREAKVLVS